MNTQVIFTVKLTIPSSEIDDIDNEALKKFINHSVGITDDLPQCQFSRYGLSDFSPEIKDLWRNAKQLI